MVNKHLETKVFMRSLTKIVLTVSVIITFFLIFVSLSPATNIRGLRIESVKKLERQTKDPKFFMLGIGINVYNEFQKLQTPISDVKAVKNILIQRYLFEPEYIIELFDGDATRSNINKTFLQLRQRIGKDDSLLIYYAGHGYYNEEDPYGYWIPFDGKKDDRSTWISNPEIIQFIRMIESRHTLLISDSCYAGELFNYRDRIPYKIPRKIRQTYKRDSRMALTSGANEPVLDTGINDRHSVFAHYLIRVLERNDQPYIVPSSDDFFGSLRLGLKHNAKQIPQYGYLINVGHAEGEFVFFLKEGEYDPAFLDDYERQPEDPIDDEKPRPASTNALKFTNPHNATLKINGKKWFLDESPVIFLKQGNHPFSLSTGSGDKIYGILKNLRVNEDTQLATFGLSDGILFKNKHIRAAWEGRPVRYSISLSTPRGSYRVIEYVLSLQRLR